MMMVKKKTVQCKLLDAFPTSEDESLCCVCDFSLARCPRLRAEMITGTSKEATRIRNEIREMRKGCVKDADSVVAAPCGHLFHRFCLRHYCFVFQVANKKVGRVECPKCFQALSMVKFQTVDFKSHLQIGNQMDKRSKEAMYMNSELKDQHAHVRKEYGLIQNKLNESKQKLTTYRNLQTNMPAKVIMVEKSLKEKEWLHKSIAKCDEIMESTYRENINIVRMYLSVMKDQSEGFLRDKRIPEPLIPYLKVIMEDDKLMEKFGQIIKPLTTADGLHSNTELLIKEILADERVATHNNVEQMRKPVVEKAKDMKRVVVKVQRSSMSIFTTSALDQESLDMVMRKVEGPIQNLRKAHDALTTFANPCLDASKDSRVRQSVSEIKVILEPRRIRGHAAVVNKGAVAFVEVDPVKIPAPARRCRSTDAIFVSANLKNEASLDLIKLDPCAVGDGDATKTETLPQATFVDCSAGTDSVLSMGKPKVTEEITLSTNDANKPTEIDVETDFEKCSTSTSDTRVPSTNAIQEGNCDQPEVALDDGENPIQICTSRVPETIFQILYEDAANNKNCDNDILSKSTHSFEIVAVENKPTTPSSQVEHSVIEYRVSTPFKKLAADACTNTDTLQRVSHNFDTIIVPDDVEGALKISEIQESTFISPKEEAAPLNGRLWGILPGPYTNHMSTSSELLPPPMIPSYPTYSPLPVYQSRWLTKLPSASARPVVPQVIPRVYRCNETCDQNRPYQYYQEQEDARSENIRSHDNYSSRSEQRLHRISPKHTVINIPSSNLIIVSPSPTQHNFGPLYRSHCCEFVSRPQASDSVMMDSRGVARNSSNDFCPRGNNRSSTSVHGPISSVQIPMSTYSQSAPNSTRSKTIVEEFHCHDGPIPKDSRSRVSNSTNNRENKSMNAFVQYCRGLPPPRVHGPSGALERDRSMSLPLPIASMETKNISLNSPVTIIASATRPMVSHRQTLVGRKRKPRFR